MIRDVTLGRYKEGKGVLYELDPRTKLMGLLLYIVSLFVFKTWLGFTLTLIFFLVLRKLSKISFVESFSSNKHILSCANLNFWDFVLFLTNYKLLCFGYKPPFYLNM